MLQYSLITFSVVRNYTNIHVLSNFKTNMYLNGIFSLEGWKMRQELAAIEYSSMTIIVCTSCW